MATVRGAAAAALRDCADGRRKGACDLRSRRWRRFRLARAGWWCGSTRGSRATWWWGSRRPTARENVCLATRAARVLIFPVTEANIVGGAARGVTAIRLDSKDRVLGFMLANKKREGLTVRTNRGGDPDRAGDQVPGDRPRRQGLRDPAARLARCGRPGRGRAGAEPGGNWRVGPGGTERRTSAIGWDTRDCESMAGTSRDVIDRIDDARLISSRK